MNKAALIDRIAEKTGAGKKLSEAMLNSFVDITIEELQKEGDVSITGFGTFETMTRYSRGGVNPQKPTERIQIPAVTVAKFRTGKRLKDSLKEIKRGAPAQA